MFVSANNINYRKVKYDGCGYDKYEKDFLNEV